MVARGAGAAGPVLLACRQQDPRGLARRLPSLGAGAWRGAPLLPWRVQCPGCVCAALAASSGGLGRCRVLCLPPFPLPAPHFLRCVWRAVPSACSLSSLAGTPFHAVCAFRGLGPVALLVFPACPLCVCALALPRRLRPPPPLPLVGVARAPRAVPVLGAGRAVPRGPCPSVCPAPVPCPVQFVFWGVGGLVPFPLYLAWGRVFPVGWVCASGAFLRRGVGWGGGSLCAFLPDCAAGAGQWGGGSPCLSPSLCLPWAGNKAGVLGVALALEGVAPIPLCFMLACCLLARSVWRPCALARVPLSIAVPAGAGDWGVEAGPAPASLPGTAVLLGGGAIIPSASGGRGAGATVACGSAGGGWGDRGRSHSGSPPPPSGGGGLRPSAQSPFRRRRIPPRCTRSLGYVGCGLLPAGQPGGRGAGEGRPVSRPPEVWLGGRGAGGSLRLRPCLCPLWSGNNAGLIGDAQVMGGAAPILLQFVVACRPGAWSVRCSCALDPRRSRRWGLFWVSRALLGEGGCPLGVRGGWRAGAPRGPQVGGGGVGGRGGGGAPLFPIPLAWRASPWPPSLSPWAPPLGIHIQPGLPGSRGRRVRPGRPPLGQCGGGRGKERSLCRGLPPPPSPGVHQGRLLRLRTPGCRHSIAAHGAGAEPPVGSG